MARPRLVSRILMTVAGAVAVAGVFVAAVLWQYGALRDQRMADAGIEAQRVLVAFDDHVNRLFAYADSYLRMVRTLYLENGGQPFVGQDDGERFRRLIETIKPPHSDSFVGPVGITDAEGYAIFGTVKNFARNVSIANLPYFEKLKTGEADTLVINSTRFAKFSGQFTFRIARRIVVDGKFAGIAIMTLRPEVINDFYQKFDLGPNSALAMIHTQERKLIARQPAVSADHYDKPIGDTVDWNGLSAERVHINVVPRGLDGISRTFYAKTLADYPVAIAVGVAPADVDAALAGLRWNLAALTVGVVAGVAVVAGLIVVILRSNFHLGGARAVAEAERRQSEAILASAGEGICGVDAGGRITFINVAARRILGWGDGQGVGEVLPLALRDDGDGQGTGAVERADGRRIDTEYSAAVLPGAALSGGPGGKAVRVVVFRDVTERRRLETKLTRTLAELEQFAYVASHDLRQPLRVISQYLSIIKDELGDALSDDHRDYLAFAIDGAQRMNQLIVDLLEYSSTGQHPELHPVKLDALIDQAVGNLQVAVAEAGAKIVVAHPLPEVNGHSGELTRLLQNLIGNAIKYRAADRPPEVTISCRRGDDDDWVIAVADNGIGIRPEHFERVFAIFQRLVTRQQYEGSGIGLAICKKVVEHHGGRIWVESVFGEGTTFLFTLPRIA